VTIDRRDLPFGEKWQAELAEFIRLSDTVVWLVSEASIQSKWVNWELDEVAKRNKRLVPLMVTEVPTAKWSELRYGLKGPLEDHDGEAAQA
jgi:hypothetical protein